jgi:hypothetical protein
MFRSSLFAFALASLAAMPLAALAQPHSEPRPTMALSGHGEVKARPDMAIVTIGAMTSGTTAREALDLNNKAMEAIMASLKSAGIEDRDIQTSGFSVAPRYNYNQSNEPPKVVGYDVMNNVTVMVRQLAGLGKILDTAVSQGSNTINGVSFTIADPEPLRDEARKLAFADARRKADIYAGAAKISLGDIVSLSEASGMQPPVPVYAKTMAAEASRDVPIAAGEQVISVDVNVVWALR